MPQWHPSLPELIAKAVYCPSPLGAGAGGRSLKQQQQAESSDAALAPATPPQPRQPAPGGVLQQLSFAERKQAMTRVSATVDELLGAIVGELV